MTPFTDRDLDILISSLEGDPAILVLNEMRWVVNEYLRTRHLAPSVRENLVNLETHLDQNKPLDEQTRSSLNHLYQLANRLITDERPPAENCRLAAFQDALRALHNQYLK